MAGERGPPRQGGHWVRCGLPCRVLKARCAGLGWEAGRRSRRARLWSTKS